jgi:hypothetical protein
MLVNINFTKWLYFTTSQLNVMEWKSQPCSWIYIFIVFTLCKQQFLAALGCFWCWLQLRMCICSLFSRWKFTNTVAFFINMSNEKRSHPFLWNENLKSYKRWMKEKLCKKLQNSMTLAVLLMVMSEGKTLKLRSVLPELRTKTWNNERKKERRENVNNKRGVKLYLCGWQQREKGA